MLLNLLPMQQNFNEILPLLPDSSRVWVYAASRPLTGDDKVIAENLLNRFISQWATHGSAMTAGACVLFDRFLVIAADEQKMAASGCSIDSSVRVIKEIGQTISVDFFDRLNVYIETSESIQYISYHELKQNVGNRHFNVLVNDLGQLRTNWPEVIS
jgi:hypothetical protein